MIIQDYIIRKKEIKPSLGVDTIHNSIFECFFFKTLITHWTWSITIKKMIVLKGFYPSLNYFRCGATVTRLFAARRPKAAAEL